MKLGLVIYGSLDTLSGGYMYDRRLVEYLRAQGDTVEIISLHWRNYAAHLTDNFYDVIASGAHGATKQSRPDGKFDILIQDELNHPSLIAANHRPHPCPIVSLVHHLRCSELRPKWQNALYRIVEKKYLQSVDGFIFNSLTTRDAVNSLIGNSKPSIVAYPPTDRFGKAISEEEIKTRAEQKPFRILFLGNLIERKGLHTLLQALFILHPSSFILDIVGSLTVEPACTRKIQTLIVENHLSSFVFLHGPLDNEPLKQKLQQAHLLVVPSSYEGFGIVYLEGMCFGLPAIGTTAGAAGEIIEHGKTGYLIEPNDSAALATHISQLASDRSLLARLSLDARTRYTQQPLWDEIANNIRNFLLDMI
ncbi:MAG: glycosyltransferase family 1 protein [Anaerolineaceae bacterium]|jgi:glycosyltransferase involved in cell wall biosynthesis|nr:MAG: glycosyltransferase family 1 protein [Anaerolineaceae bacterium]